MRSLIDAASERVSSVCLSGWILGFLCLVQTGCSQASRDRLLSPAPVFPAVIRPLDRSVGSVVMVHERLRFVVLDYSLSTLPPTGSTLEIYRASQRVGRVRLSRWNSPTTAAADFLEGLPQVGDVARPD